MADNQRHAQQTGLQPPLFLFNNNISLKVYSHPDKMSVYLRGCRSGALFFYRLKHSRKYADTLCSQVITRYYEPRPTGFAKMAQYRETMTYSFLYLVKAIWNACEHHLDAYMPQAMIEVEQIEGVMSYQIHRDQVYYDYLNHLPFPSFSFRQLGPAICRSRLFFLRYLDGSGTKAVVTLGLRSSERFLCKMFDFSDYFLHGDERFCQLHRAWEDEVRVAKRIPWHFNILTPDRGFLTEPGTTPTRICGMLVPCLSGCTLDNQADSTTSFGVLAVWCAQMSAAVAHIHLVARLYHMDIRPGNFLLDDEGNAKLMNWGQRRASSCTLAPEVDGSTDIVPDSHPDCPSYRPAPPSPNGTGRFGGRGWNVFSRWMQSYPRAVEAAEVYSLAKAMSFVLVGVKEGRRPVEDDRILAALEQRGVPGHWSEMVHLCLCPSPMRRPRISDVQAFWQMQPGLYPRPAGQPLISPRARVSAMAGSSGATAGSSQKNVSSNANGAAPAANHAHGV